MRHKTKDEAIKAAKADYSAGKYGVTHSVGYESYKYIAERDGVWRVERDCDGGTQGIKNPTRRIYR